jgi:hypothetical protein
MQKKINLKIIGEMSCLMSKVEMIESIETLIKANKDNDNCSVYWLADMIKEVIEEVTDE